jgi:serine/threonine protein kinase
MAPETFTDAEPTRASDIYSLGVTLYVLARGLLDESVMVRTQLEQVMAGEHAPLLECLPQFDPDLARLIERCMARDPKARPQDASALLAALESLPLEPGGLRLGQTVIEDAEPGLEWIEEARRVLAEVPPAPDAPAGPQASGKGGTHLTPRVEPQRVPNAPIEAETQRRPRLSIPALTAMTAVALLALFAWASLLKGDGDPEPGGDEGEVAQAPVTQTDDSGESGGVDEPQDPPGTGSKGPDAVGELGEGSGTNTESTQTDETSESPDGPQPEPDPPILTPVGEGTIEGVPGDEDDESEESQPSPFELLFTQLDKPAEEEFTLYRLNYDLGLSAASQTYLRFLQTYSGVMVA